MAPQKIPLFHDVISLDSSSYFIPPPRPPLHPQTGQQNQAVMTAVEEINIYWTELRRADEKMELKAARRQEHIVHIIAGCAFFMVIIAIINAIGTMQGFPLSIYMGISMLVSTAAMTLSLFTLYQTLKDYKNFKRELILKNRGARKL